MANLANNPYRILGVLSNATKKEIVASEGKLKTFAKIGRETETINDLNNLLPKVERSLESINKASNELSIPKERILNGLFWFMQVTERDENALNEIRKGNLNAAISILKMNVNYSQLVNTAIVLLLQENYEAALFPYIKLLESAKYREELFEVITDNKSLFTETEFISAFASKLLSLFPDVEWLWCFATPEITVESKQVPTSDMYRKSKLFAFLKPIFLKQYKEQFELIISDASQKERLDGNSNLKAANDLYRKGGHILSGLKFLLGFNDPEYCSFCDKIANQILDNCIAYYNKDENNPNRPKNVMQYTKYALRKARGQVVKERCQRNYDIIKEAYDLLPPEEVSAEVQNIDSAIAYFRKNIFQIKESIEKCRIALASVKNKLGSDHPFYISKSSEVVHEALNVVVDVINADIKRYEDAPLGNDYQEKRTLSSHLSSAKEILERLRAFDKDENCANRYKENHDTLLSLHSKYYVGNPTDYLGSASTSQRPSTASQSSSGHRPRPTAMQQSSERRPQPYIPPRRPVQQKNTNNNQGSDGCLAKFLIGIGVFVLGLIILIISNNNSDNKVQNNQTQNTEETTEATYDNSTYGDTYSESSTYEEPSTNEEPVKSQEEVWLETYRNNCLKTGATPYKSVYGANSNKGTSKLRITAPETCDVLVIIKNNSGDVVKHAYINAFQTYTFTMRRGTYQPFFVFGKSWCPEKLSPSGEYGYFLEDVSISKDSPQFIDDYQELQYTLQMRQNGNFSAQHSDASEAF